MAETIVNLFLYVEGGVIKSLGAVGHEFDGSDDYAIAFLHSRAALDASRATHYPLPVESIKSGLGVGAEQGLALEAYDYLSRTGKALALFEEPLRSLNAPGEPLVCITPIVDGKPRIEALTHIDSSVSAAWLSKSFDRLVRHTDYLRKYATPSGFNVSGLLGDDFLDAIQLLYEHKRYVSAMKLLVSFVDTVAYLDLGDVAGNFESWLSNYAALAPVGVTPSELWEFRNALLHMTNPLSRRVLSGKARPLHFHVDPTTTSVLVDQASGAKLFSFLALHEAIVEAVGRWVNSYSKNLSKQLELIQRYDTVLSEGRIAQLGRK